MTTEGRQTLRLALWGLCVAVWTVFLLTPHPVRVGHQVLPPTIHYPVSKCLHVGVYALLTGMLPWLGPRSGLRWGLVVFLSLHAAATEWAQQWVPERTGSLTDVGFDHVGIVLGLACTWWAWWSPRRASEANREAPLSPAAGKSGRGQWY
jgi:VanZ family protein